MIEKRRTIAMPRIEIIIEPDIIREPSLLSDETQLDDEPIAIDNEIDEEDDFSLFAAINRDEILEQHESPTLFNQSDVKPKETNPLAEIESDNH
jgi:hypothetical protein